MTQLIVKGHQTFLLAQIQIHVQTIQISITLANSGPTTPRPLQPVFWFLLLFIVAILSAIIHILHFIIKHAVSTYTRCLGT